MLCKMFNNIAVSLPKGSDSKELIEIDIKILYNPEDIIYIKKVNVAKMFEFLDRYKQDHPKKNNRFHLFPEFKEFSALMAPKLVT